MYEDYTRQALPSKTYRELLGTSICVFNSNNAFIIENILRNDTESKYNWYELIDRTPEELLSPIKEIITKNSNTSIANKFDKLISMRNRIINSFQITNDEGEQILATKDKEHKQYVITEDYLQEFITLNEELSSALHEFRGY